MRRLILASASPRRRQLLADAGIDFAVRPAAIDERPLPGEAALDYVARIARAKAAAVARGPGDAVLGADTEVIVDGRVLGKPADVDDARRMIGALSGRSHTVASAVALVVDEGWRERVVVSTVHMREITEAEIAAYCATTEPFDKAGGYGVQGRAAAFVEAIDGSHSGVVGLPLFETLALLAEVGITAWGRPR